MDFEVVRQHTSADAGSRRDIYRVCAVAAMLESNASSKAFESALVTIKPRERGLALTRSILYSG